jgi:hypothetical protein
MRKSRIWTLPTQTERSSDAISLKQRNSEWLQDGGVRNCTRITVNSNVDVFAVLERLGSHVTLNFEHAEATLPASHRTKPLS